MASQAPPATPPVTPPPAGGAPRKGRGVRILLKGLLFLLVIVGGIVAYASVSQPDNFKISRTVTVAAAPEAVFPHVNNLHKFHEWNPFAETDPNGKFTYDGPEEGVGAKQSWSGDANLGEGTMTIVESKPNELVKMDLLFVRPMAAQNDAVFTFKPEGGKTSVTWEMNGAMPLLNKVMCLFIDLDKMVGEQFEKGLNKMKTKAEAPTP